VAGKHFLTKKAVRVIYFKVCDFTKFVMYEDQRVTLKDRGPARANFRTSLENADYTGRRRT
jgi:hypothetical protein